MYSPLWRHSVFRKTEEQPSWKRKQLLSTFEIEILKLKELTKSSPKSGFFLMLGLTQISLPLRYPYVLDTDLQNSEKSLSEKIPRPDLVLKIFNNFKN